MQDLTGYEKFEKLMADKFFTVLHAVEYGVP